MIAGGAISAPHRVNRSHPRLVDTTRSDARDDMDFQTSGLTEAELRARADQLREVLGALEEGDLEASARERAFIAGALRAVELMREDSG